MKYQIVHSTRYEYSESAALSLNEICLKARKTPFQTVLSHRFETSPKEEYYRERVDFFGNAWRLYSFEKPHKLLEIISINEVEVGRDPAQGDGQLEGYEVFLYPSPFVPLDPQYAEYGRGCFPPGGNLLDGFLDLNRMIYRDMTYDPKATDVSTPVETFFRDRKGVCQDYTHLMLAVLRSLGIPARYVSGYLNTLPPPGKEKIQGADASHAWVGVYHPQFGWIDLDPTNGIPVGNNHITLAWGRDYGDVSPLKGVVLGGGLQTLKVEVTVREDRGG